MSVYSVLDFFNIVSILEAQQFGEPTFKVMLASGEKEPVHGGGEYKIEADMSLSSIEQPDFIILPPIAGPFMGKVNEARSHEISWLKRQVIKGRQILSLTTSSELLAATGLYEGKILCNHWAFANRLKREYPNVQFATNQSFLFNGNTYSTGTLTGTFDALLCYVSHVLGDQFAQTCAAHLLVTEPSKTPPLLYQYRNHADKAMLEVQSWLENNYQVDCSIGLLAKRFGFSERNLKRRFTNATQIPPNKYLQKVRIDKAKKLLLSTSFSIKKIALEVGYENDSFFNRIFKKETGVTLNQWRLQQSKLKA